MPGRPPRRQPALSVYHPGKALLDSQVDAVPFPYIRQRVSQHGERSYAIPPTAFAHLTLDRASRPMNGQGSRTAQVFQEVD